MRYAFLLVSLSVALLPRVTAQPADTTAAGTSVSGRVLDAEGEEPLAGVHVFLASTMIGTTTDVDGRFELADVPTGAHTVYASMIGFAGGSESVFVVEGERVEVTFRLAPAVVELGEIAVEARRDKQWERRRRKFERLFLGETSAAADVHLRNPEVLRFSGGWGKLVVHAAAPLVIENEALGYRVHYHLEEFIQQGSTIKYDGEPFFEEMRPASAEQAQAWAANRARAFYGSFRHFMLAVLDGSTQEEGFLTFIRPGGSRLSGIGDSRFSYASKRMLGDAPTDTTRTLKFYGHVEVVYTGEEEAPAYARRDGRRPGNQRSFMTLTDGPTAVDYSGEIVDPYGVTVYGYFAYERVAEELPREYRPPG